MMGPRRHAGPRSMRAAAALVGGETALALVLLVAGGLFAASLRRCRTPSGFRSTQPYRVHHSSVGRDVPAQSAAVDRECARTRFAGSRRRSRVGRWVRAAQHRLRELRPLIEAVNGRAVRPRRSCSGTTSAQNTSACLARRCCKVVPSPTPTVREHNGSRSSMKRRRSAFGRTRIRSASGCGSTAAATSIGRIPRRRSWVLLATSPINRSTIIRCRPTSTCRMRNSRTRRAPCW